MCQFAFFLLAIACATVRTQSNQQTQAAESGPDKETAAGIDWKVNGKMVTYPTLLANNKYAAFQTQIYLATSDFKEFKHCRDGGGTDRTHQHVQNQWAVVADANRFYDKLFGASDAPAKTTRFADADTTINCYGYALKNHLGKGTYAYWVDQNGMAADSCLNTDTDNKAKNTVSNNDGLYYKTGNDHITVVLETEQVGETTDRRPTKLRWKAGVSGVYDYTTNGYDTPKYTPISGNPDGTVNFGTWTTNAVGDSKNLDPKDNVRRKK
jgi:hypothetical protein